MSRVCWLYMLPVSVGSLAASVFADSSASPSVQEAMIEEVLVFTQYRSENSQQLPISMSLFSSADIERFDVHDNQTLANITPGLSHAEFAAGQSYLAIRGILSIDDGPGMDSSVVVFQDGVYIGRLGTIDFDLFDIERVEVLRGPQGTLFGRNAIGGAINIITVKPEDGFNSKAQLTVGDYDTRRVALMLNAGAEQGLSGRLSAQHREHSAYTTNVLLNQGNQDEDKNSLRGHLAWQGEQQHWLLSADYLSDDRADMGRFPVEESNLSSYAQWLSLGGGIGKTTSPISGYSMRSAQGVSLQHRIQLSDESTIESILAYRDSDNDWAMASTGAPLLPSPPFPAMDLSQGLYGGDVRDLIVENIEQSSFETRWLKDINEQLHFTLGMFLLREDTHRAEHYQLVSNSVAGGEQLLGDEVTQQQNVTKSQAIYSQLLWNLNASWRFTVGARWTKDSKKTDSLSVNCGLDDELVSSSGLCNVDAGSYLNIITSAFDVSAEQTWTDVSPKFVAQYQGSDAWMSYFSVARGYKSGGFPGSPNSETVAQTAVDPEQAWNYELGLKTDLLDRRLRLNGNIFYTDYEDLQIVRFGPSPDNPNFGSFTTTNIGRAEIYGTEIEAHWLATRSLRFDASYAYLHSVIDDLIIETTTGTVDASGSPLRQAPENSYHLAMNYELPLAKRFGRVDFDLSYHYADSQLSDYVNQDTRIDSLSQTDAAIHWSSLNKPVKVSLWVRNIEDERRVAHSYTIAGGVFGVWSPPQTMGLTLTVGQN